MPRIIDIEDTPNPNAKKFILKEPLSWGIAHSYENAEMAKDDALASELFDLEHVTNVFYIDHWITITQDGRADWRELMRQLAGPIRAAPAAEAKSAQLRTASQEGRLADLDPADKERLDRINSLLDSQIRPYLQSDGGDLYVTGFRDNRLTVHYQGACGSCPSSLSGTLAAVESLVKSIEPDVDVVAA